MASSAVLFLELPPKTFVGINLASFSSSPNFHGIINLPPGYHFIYTGTDISLSIRHGHWLRVKPRSSTSSSVYVFKWNYEHENLVLLDSSDDESAIAAINSIPSLAGKGLVDYIALQDATSKLQSSQTTGTNTASHRFNHSDSDPGLEHAWPELTSHVSSSTLTRILSPSHIDAPETVSSPPRPITWTLSSISSGAQDTEPIPGLSSTESDPVVFEAGGTLLNFVPINLKQTWPDDSVGRDRTDKARDKSWYLNHLISSLSGGARDDGSSNDTSSNTTKPSSTDKKRGAKELLAELQICFVMVLTLANYSCLEQWKRILSVVFGSESAIGEVEGYFVEVVRVLRVQLGRVEDVEGGLFEMSDEIGSRWLRNLLRTFRTNVDEMLGKDSTKDGLKDALEDLEVWLRETYGWADEAVMLRRGMLDLEDGERVEVQLDGLDEEEETGEYAPVVVEI